MHVTLSLLVGVLIVDHYFENRTVWERDNLRKE